MSRESRAKNQLTKPRGEFIITPTEQAPSRRDSAKNMLAFIPVIHACLSGEFTA